MMCTSGNSYSLSSRTLFEMWIVTIRLSHWSLNIPLSLVNVDKMTEGILKSLTPPVPLINIISHDMSKLSFNSHILLSGIVVKEV